MSLFDSVLQSESVWLQAVRYVSLVDSVLDRKIHCWPHPCLVLLLFLFFSFFLVFLFNKNDWAIPYLDTEACFFNADLNVMTVCCDCIQVKNPLGYFGLLAGLKLSDLAPEVLAHASFITSFMPIWCLDHALPLSLCLRQPGTLSSIHRLSQPVSCFI